MIGQRKTLLASLASGAAIAAGSAHAAPITYIDAQEIVVVDSVETGNTYASGQARTDSDYWLVPNGTVTAGKWERDDDLAVSGGNAGSKGGYVFQGNSGDPELTTEITGLSDGTYNIWVFYWAREDNHNWGIHAGLAPGTELANVSSLPYYSDVSNGVNASNLTFTNSPIVNRGTESNISPLYGSNLGQVVVTGGAVVNVYINDKNGNATTRTWYEGVGYELVPEPSSLAMLGLGSLLIARRRRN